MTVVARNSNLVGSNLKGQLIGKHGHINSLKFKRIMDNGVARLITALLLPLILKLTF